MRNIILFLIAVVLLICFMLSSLNKNKTTFSNEVKVTIYDQVNDVKKVLNLEDYIVGVVAAEMPASFEYEALKAQAIAARTYAMYKIDNSSGDYDLVTDVSNQAYIDDEAMKNKWNSEYEFYKAKIERAVSETKNIIMTNHQKAICAYYFAISNGYTEDSTFVFGESHDYIKSTESLWDINVNNYEVTTTLSKNEFCEKLNINCDEITINNIDYTSSHRVNSITINGTKFTGVEVRKKLDLRSTDFEIIIGSDITIITKGYGHGVGMSQYGANEMAKMGKTYEEILNYYYKNIKLEQIHV